MCLCFILPDSNVRRSDQRPIFKHMPTWIWARKVVGIYTVSRANLTPELHITFSKVVCISSSEAWARCSVQYVILD